MVAPPTPCDEVVDRLPEDTDAIRGFEIDYKQQMSSSELTIYNNMSRVDQLSYLINAQSAMNMAVSQYPNISQRNTKADAFRHAYFSLLNTMTFGKSLAKSLGDAHETKPGDPQIEKDMDLFNNNVGRELFAGYIPSFNPAGYFSDKINILIQSGELLYINNGVLTPTNR